MNRNNIILLVTGILIVSAVYGFFVMSSFQQKTQPVPVTKQQLLDAQSMLRDLDPNQEKNTTPFAEDMLSDQALGLK